VIELYALSFARAYGVFLMIPLTAVGISETQRISIAALFGIILGPKHFELTLLPAEFFIGIVLALPVTLFLDFFIQAAECFDSARGSSQDVIYSPLTQHQEHSLQQVVRVLGIALLCSSNALGFLLEGCTRVQSGVLWSGPTLGKIIFNLVQEIGVGVICFVIPFSIAAAIIEFVMGWAAKLLPNLSITNELFLLRLIAGVVFLRFAVTPQTILSIRDGVASLSSIVPQMLLFGS